MAKPNPLLDYLLDPGNRDERSSRFTNPNRLHFNYLGVYGSWGDVAGIIAEPMCSSLAWFPDANVAFLDPTTPVWDALRLSALGSPIGSTVISGVAEYEMKEWLNDPYRNKERAADIKAAMVGETWIRKFRIAPSHTLNKALYGYTHLLGFRRSLARQLSDGTTLVDTDASDKSRTMNEIRNRFGPRAQGLAKKGRTEDETKGVINIDDEMHCLMAILYALMNSRPTVILTADVDYLEIFYKGQWFLDAHYRAWLAAKMVKAGEYGEPVKDLQETDGHFQGPLTLYRRHTLHLQEVLPLRAQAVTVTLIYVAPDGRLHIMSFPFELPMLEMIEMRSKTDGRCTDLFGEANIHVDLGPLKRGLDGLYLGIGRDVVYPFTTNEVHSSFARLDLQHSVSCFERFSA
ncbi:MAG: hypothetical protein HYS12_01160 [Planctomycetes bacterium]|nr:hypothetical protein [Planctomycetota bacterium]